MHNQQQQQGGHRSSRRQLPPQVELASRIEEAKNTAKILLQLIQSTPSEEVMSNELIREFADRCQTAQKSMQGYINCDSPPPDDDTMLTLIETNEQLSLAASRYQRSVLSARRAMGLTTSPNAEAMQGPNAAVASPPPGPPSASQGTGQSESLFAASPPPRQLSPQQNWAPPQQPPPSRNPATSESFSPPPGPPPSMLARLNSREDQPTVSQNQPPQSQAPQLPAIEQPSNPFADPLEHDANSAPLAYGQSQSNPANRPHSHTFSIDAGPTYESPPAPPPKSNQRPWQETGATPSYIGRQTSAANGITMHGAGGAPDRTVSEIDGHSEVGRSPTTPTRNTESDRPYDVSPVQSRLR